MLMATKRSLHLFSTRKLISIRPILHKYCRSMMTEGKLDYADGSYIFYKKRIGPDSMKPGIVFCSGYSSNLNGNKAKFLDHFCAKNGLSYIRFDYMGHEFSSGSILDSTISLWKQNVLDVLDQLTTGPQIIVGSSIGGWLSLLAAVEKPDRVHSLVGIANAADFFREKYCSLSRDEEAEIQRIGYYKESDTIIPYQLLKDSMNHVLLHRNIPINCPIRLIHGMQDDVIPYQTSLHISDKVDSSDVIVHLVKDGDHRMSTKKDLALLENVLNDLLENC